MLKEVPEVRQENEPGYRRWFEDECFDLIVWYDERSAITGFQLCYNKGKNEHAFTWRQDRGLSHNRVDVGEDKWGRSRTPILIADGVFPEKAVLSNFRAASVQLDVEVARLVIEKIDSYASYRTAMAGKLRR
jgi:hypothetical protein